MPDSHWENLKEIFHATVALARHERAAYLEQACGGDASLRAAVESLLKSHEETNNFVDAPAYQAAAEMLVNSADLKAGENIAHYRIVRLLGEGGMGTVYLAEDTKLHRQVSLKFLSTRFIQDPERLRRFEQEARAASALNHPNIIHIYEIGHSDSTHFIAAEYLDGATLRTYLPTTPVQSSEVLDIALQVASALAAAHAKGIVHRDIKPENIMVDKRSHLGRQNHVKVLDFGIAKLADVPGIAMKEATTRLLVRTEEGRTIGTASYMSPEQARGESVDARTDIWSLGVVLYEMVTGKQPFTGNTPQDVIASILRDDLPPLPLESPEGLKWILKKALRKDRDDRYQTARELFSDLRDLHEQAQGVQSNADPSVPPTPDTEYVGRTKAAPAREPEVETREASARATSSAEYIISEIKRLRGGAIVVLTVVVIAVVGLA